MSLLIVPFNIPHVGIVVLVLGDDTEIFEILCKDQSNKIMGQ